MAEPTSDADLQAALADANTPAPLRAAYEALRVELDTERTNRAQLERRTAFAEAGLADLPHRELFEKTYEGEMTAEAIRTEAQKYNLIPDPNAPAPAKPEDRSDLEALRRVGQASSGTPVGAGLSLNDEIMRARSPKEIEDIIRRRGAEEGIELSRVSSRGHRIV